ncbi:MAG: flavodoxin [Candidatus Omnitrophica bacterium]|nr:flavodoxin [Candidatus Omnitrophota bacterium]
MKSLVVYYSNTGNTRKVAKILIEALKAKGEAEGLELVALDEAKSFMGQCSRAFQHKKAKIAEVNFDLARYDLVCVGTPVWAFGPAPALNTYLDKCTGVQGKDVILFCTYGSGSGRERCIDRMQKILLDKGAKGFNKLFIQQSKVNKKEFVIDEIGRIIK